MADIKYFISVPYSVEQMFHLVNDINSYTKFLPGCNVSRILEQNNNELIAEINIASNGIGRSIITHNFFTNNKSISILLVKGPFKSFYGYWKFIPITSAISRIEYSTHYEFQSIFIEKIFNHIFKTKYKNIITAFISRAHIIYGPCQTL
ncbi:type II toxin-antitoxin system RatA family toxin [Blochmannia endosymbiont of Camponotus sp. C-003]|uniref:type II toxin-antitoxin system RatA family toxin n=1 Tax=unclassified Candidatus Blochmanniella TaxID=711328 RepID=UPI0020241C00|nr:MULTISPECIES: type II toxin-antitoxin system RatA family toxin [unclassified Candidatus Blochmannia]URJ23294.1 type II toxin-antitoxin system RatA family toxin [Blochmannia endosymbiont of Camponotus sp. C-003]URJ28767.1 type II toxin-antitoxin system RatA family toxin [Blochmannia endosymbiont of Camponotus sp. C-046]